MEDLRHFVDAAHDLGMYVILDWVANHTAWDNVLVEEHPEWYERDWKGDFCPTPWWDWVDIIDLDFNSSDLRRYMADAMAHWVREADIDGFRCDVAGFVPTDFWEQVRRELDAIKPVFMLAEWESRDLHTRAFDMTYAWSWNETMHHIAVGKADVESLRVYYAWNDKAYPDDSIRMLFVSNHDKNAWEGTEYEQFGDALEAAIVLSVVSDGMPLIYNGQEAGQRPAAGVLREGPDHLAGAPDGRVLPRAVRAQAIEHGAVERPLGRADDQCPQRRPQLGPELRPPERAGQGLRGLQPLRRASHRHVR